MKIIFVLLLTGVSCSFAFGQETASSIEFLADADSIIAESPTSTGFDFFASEEPLEMTLTFEIKEFLKTKNEPENFDATLQLVTNDKDTLTQEIKIKARGERRRDYCSFPPIMLKFKDKKDESEAIFNGGNIKLVTHCSQSSTYENFVFKEYLAYKLYNLITPYSFKTRLVIIHYNDVDNPAMCKTEYGFLIENVEHLAARNNAIVIDNPNLSQHNMDDYEMARMAFFNFMIGNTDWSIREQHNIKVLKTDDPLVEKGIPVAYDFDYSGFVNTSYSTPTMKIPITYVTERYYLGGCYTSEIFTSVFGEFEAMKDEFIAVINQFQLLPGPFKKQSTNYINSFFKKYKFPNELISNLNSTCKKL
jgi:hypothetical protein